MILESFFCRKVDLIRNDLDAITVVPPVLNVPPSEKKFEKFETSQTFSQMQEHLELVEQQ